ncbi:MAG: hypothetical protein RIQ52_82 [Pseudomonadota bacterium]|jgi:peptidyl-prolyl cis-trans isomerase D
MMQFIREKAQGIFAWVMLVLVGIPFALWGINNYLDDGHETPVASVGDRDFFDRDVNRAFEQDRASMPALAELDETQLRKQSLERLIRDEVILQKARSERMRVGDEGLRLFAQSLPYFQTDGHFDKDKYKMVLASQGISQEQFLLQVQQAVISEQWQHGIMASPVVTEADVTQFLQLQRQSREVETMTLPLVTQLPAVSDQAVEDYFREHGRDFMTPEKVSVDYVVLRMADVAKQVTVSEDDLQRFYEEQKSAFVTEERRRVSHIMFAADPAKPETMQKAMEKAEAALVKIKAGEDFAKQAKMLSDDKPSALNGGDLGLLVKGSQDPAFEAAAMQLAKGAVSSPVTTGFGVHLIQVTELEPGSVKPYAQVKAELVEAYRRNQAESRFYELAQKISEQAFEHPDSLDVVAATLNVAIEHSQMFARTQGDGIAAEEVVRKAAFSEDVLAGKNSDAVEMGDDQVVVLHMNQHEEAHQQTLDTANRIAIRLLLQQQAAQEATHKALAAAMEAARAGKTLEELARAGKYTWKAAAVWQRDSAQIPPVLLQAAFTGGGDGRLASVALPSGEQVVYRVVRVIEPAADTLKPEDRERARAFLQRGEGQQEFLAYLESLRATADVNVRPVKQK